MTLDLALLYSRPLNPGEGLSFDELDEAHQFLLRQREILPTLGVAISLKSIQFANRSSYLVTRIE